LLLGAYGAEAGAAIFVRPTIITDGCCIVSADPTELLVEVTRGVLLDEMGSARNAVEGIAIFGVLAAY